MTQYEYRSRYPVQPRDLHGFYPAGEVKPFGRLRPVPATPAAAPAAATPVTPAIPVITSPAAPIVVVRAEDPIPQGMSAATTENQKLMQELAHETAIALRELNDEAYAAACTKLWTDDREMYELVVRELELLNQKDGQDDGTGGIFANPAGTD